MQRSVPRGCAVTGAAARRASAPAVEASQGPTPRHWRSHPTGCYGRASTVEAHSWSERCGRCYQKTWIVFDVVQSASSPGEHRSHTARTRRRATPTRRARAHCAPLCRRRRPRRGGGAARAHPARLGRALDVSTGARRVSARRRRANNLLISVPLTGLWGPEQHDAAFERCKEALRPPWSSTSLRTRTRATS
jgi:hypothetical protein